MNNNSIDNSEKKNNEMSVKDILLRIKKNNKYLLSKWVTIVCFGIIGALLGVAYSVFKKAQYTAKCTFVLDEGASHSGLSQYANLASLAGIDLSGGGNSGLFQGDNIIELYKSRTMIEKALLSNALIDNKNTLLIDRYIQFNQLRKRWQKEDGIDSINFNGDPNKFNRKQDSLITDIVNFLNKKVLSVSKPDKKLSIIDVEVASHDELFAKIFTDKLVETVNNFYIQTKTKKATQNVQMLQHQADSIRSILNSSISGVATAADASPNPNPFMQTLRVPSQRRQVDVQTSSAIYSEIIKNLELSKMSLSQDTPLIQVIDNPILPLTVDKIGKVKSLIIGFLLFSLASVVYISLQKVFQNLMATTD